MDDFVMAIVVVSGVALLIGLIGGSTITSYLMFKHVITPIEADLDSLRESIESVPRTALGWTEPELYDQDADPAPQTWNEFFNSESFVEDSWPEAPTSLKGD